MTSKPLLLGAWSFCWTTGSPSSTANWSLLSRWSSQTRIVVVRAGALGDFLLGLPALAALRGRFPNAHLHLAGPWPQARLAAGIADEIMSVDAPELAVLFDDTSPPDRLPRWLAGLDLAVVWLRRPRVVAGHLTALGARRVVAHPPFPEHGLPVHVADWLAASLAELDVALPEAWDTRPWLTVPAEAQSGVEAGLEAWLGPSPRHPPTTCRLPGSPALPGTEAGSEAVPPVSPRGRGGPEVRSRRPPQSDGSPAPPARAPGQAPLLVVHPGSGGARKNWPGWGEAAAEVESRAHCRLVVVAGPADDEPVARFLADYRRADGADGRRDPPIAQALALSQLAALLSRASLFLGNDSGVTHLAAAVGAPVVAAFGPTNQLIWRPRGPEVTVLGGLEQAPALLPSGHAAARWPSHDDVVGAALRALRPGRPSPRRTRSG